MTNSEFETIFDANKDAVYSFAWRMTGSPQLAEDIAQDCFLQLLRSPGRYQIVRGPVRVWLFGIARNLILKRWRAEARWVAISDEDAFAVDIPESDCRLADKVAQAVQSLAPLQREVLILVEYEGMTLEETATAVAAEVGTVKARLHRARNNLRRALQPYRSEKHVR